MWKFGRWMVVSAGSTCWRFIMHLAFSSRSHMAGLCQMDGGSVVSHMNEARRGFIECKIFSWFGEKLLKIQDMIWLEGKQEVPSGWSFKIGTRLKRADWKGRQELFVGWNFKTSRSLNRFDWRKLRASGGMYPQDQQETEKVRLEGKTRASFRMELQG